MDDALMPLHRPLQVVVDAETAVSALLCMPAEPIACYVFAHGAGAGMTHAFMEDVSNRLAACRIATLRYQFPYVERGSKRPDVPAVAHAAVHAACAAALDLTALPLVAGGKSFGGRMTSQAQALTPLPGVAGLAFLGFPLHPPGKPSSDRARHLADIGMPMLFIQGAKDKLADLPRMTRLVAGLGPNASILTIEHADHGFGVLVRSGRKPTDVMTEIVEGLAGWVETTVKSQL